FRMKTVPMETESCSSDASTTGATAAMALPPQIAVPTEIKYDELRCTPKALPNNQPTPSAKAIPHSVYTNPDAPALSTWCRFIPNPRPTTEACSRIFDALRDVAAKGCSKIRPNATPRANEIGRASCRERGESRGVEGGV